MKFLMRKPYRVAALLLVSLSALATEMTEEEKKGYWWKKEKPPETTEEPAEFPELSAPPSEEELLKLHPKQVAELIDEYRGYALWKMSPESVKWYYEMQDFARRRSRAFMNVTEVVMLQNSELNMQTSYPTNNSGQAVRNKQRQTSFDKRIAHERNNAALVLLTSESCGYCEAQRATLKHFQARHNWNVKEIDIDRQPDIAAKFGTTFTPTTVVIFKGTTEWMPVAVGVETVPKVEEAVYRSIRLLKGETSPEQFSLQEFQEGGTLDPQRSE